MGKRKPRIDELWAQHIIRVKTADGEKISAYVRRKYSDDDIDLKDPGHYIGIERTDDVPKITDNDPDSDTFGDRIPDPDYEPSENPSAIKFIEPFSKENIIKYKKLIANTIQGKTQLIYLFRDRAFNCEDEDEFFTTPIDEIRKIYTNRRQTVVLENPPK